MDRMDGVDGMDRMDEMDRMDGMDRIDGMDTQNEQNGQIECINASSISTDRLYGKNEVYNNNNRWNEWNMCQSHNGRKRKNDEEWIHATMRATQCETYHDWGMVQSCIRTTHENDHCGSG